MSFTSRIVLMLQVVTAAGLTAAAALLAWPATRAVASTVPTLPTLPALTSAMPPEVTADSVLVDSIVRANIFSPTREAPLERTVVAGPVDVVTDDVIAGSYGADAGVTDSLPSSPADDRVPALHGVVDGPMGRAALLRLDAGAQGSRLFRIGEGTAGFRVRSIGADRVELSSPAGPVVLTLAGKAVTP